MRLILLVARLQLLKYIIHNANISLDVTMTARTLPSALDSLSSSSLNKLHEAVPPSKKRKLEPDTAAGQLFSTSIVIRAHAASLSDEPLVLDPIAALPRSRLPLSWLEDASWSRSDAQPGGLFTADIPALENDLRACAEPMVLAVRLAANSGLYVIERVKRGIYSLSRLARWVHEGDVAVAVKGWQAPQGLKMDIEDNEKSLSIPDALSWWQSAQIEEPPSNLGLGEDFAALQVAVVFESEGDTGQDEPTFVDVLEHRGQSLAPTVRDSEAPFGLRDSQAVGSEAMDVEGVDSTAVDAKLPPEELLNGMRDHYLQALYASKTSLAYFAKGPLTRCRTAFQNAAPDQPQSLAELIGSYRDAILAAKKMDLKYRETLPTSVRDALLTPSDGETTKKRKSKKKKLGKNGLYPEEDGLIRKWWKDRSMESSAQENSRETESKKHISDLRLRETQLQILLILEVIALESIPRENKQKPSDEVPEEEKTSPKKPRAKKPQDLNVLLELHLDRLCIWHAVSLEESTAVDSAKTSSFTDSHMSGKKVESDAVRDFCTEVVVPFYAARLPDKCKLITRKFGVSGGISPAAKRTQSSKKDRVEPGAEVKRQAPVQKPRRSLQRVLTDERTAAASQNRHPSLHRSNTAPSKHDNKRDTMEPLLPTVFGGSVRGGIQQAKRVDNREVDLNAVARQHESKLRKVQMLVDQKKELDAAIQALRKPNRELVSNEIVDESVKRSTGGGSSRKSKNPVRNPMGEGVQVMATPRGNRRKDIIGMPPLPRSLAPSRSFAGEMEDRSLGESPVMIPSSSSIRRTISFSGPDSNPFSSRRPLNSSLRKRKEPPADLGSIQETPTRSSKLFFEEERSLDASIDRRPSSNKGRGLFRIPDLPAPRSTNDPNEPMAPSTPVSSRQKIIPSSAHGSTQNLTTSFQGASSSITETPPRQRGVDSMPASRSLPMGNIAQVPITTQSRACSPVAVMGTPVKESSVKRSPAKGPAPVIPVTPEKSQSKSIYEQLGWEEDEMEF
ncbi:hypothetical protein N7448_003546 [Penicillium atrosanguineum]|nr:hypothetical protein N7448_003546 [Penicillium atrosanguineum]